MSVFLSPIGNGQVFLAANALPANGGFINTYQAGGSTPAATYTTSVGNVANANPIVLSPAGIPPAEIWLTGGQAYKFIVTDFQGNQIGPTYDNLYGINDPSSGATAPATAITYTAPFTGAVARTQAGKNAESISAFDAFTDSQKSDVSGGTLVQDVTTAFQTSVNGVQKGGDLFLPPGKYRISAPINFTQQICVWAWPNTVTIVLATQNQNGFNIGDGTSPTRTALFSSSFENINFNVLPGVTAFTSGACFNLNYVSNIDIINCTVYGADAGTAKLWQGISAFETMESNFTKCTFRYLLDIPVKCVGGASGALATSDLRIDFCEITNCVTDLIYFGLNAYGNTVNALIAYSNLNPGAAISISATGSATSSTDIFVLQPDIEMEHSGQYAVKTVGAGTVQVIGGWIGGPVGSYALNCDSTSASILWQGVQSNAGAQFIINAPVTTISGGVVYGDNSTASTGIAVGSTAIDCIIEGVGVAQWPTNAISYSGTPNRCSLTGVRFRNNGNNVTGHNWSPASGPAVVISGCTSDIPTFQITMAASMALQVGRNVYQVTGATQCTNITPLGFGARATFQANDVNNAFANGSSGNGQILLKTSPTTLTQFHTISFVCDGNTWFEDGRSF